MWEEISPCVFFKRGKNLPEASSTYQNVQQISSDCFHLVPLYRFLLTCCLTAARFDFCSAHNLTCATFICFFRQLHSKLWSSNYIVLKADLTAEMALDRRLQQLFAATFLLCWVTAAACDVIYRQQHHIYRSEAQQKCILKSLMLLAPTWTPWTTEAKSENSEEKISVFVLLCSVGVVGWSVGWQKENGTTLAPPVDILREEKTLKCSKKMTEVCNSGSFKFSIMLYVWLYFSFFFTQPSLREPPLFFFYVML